MRVLQGQVHVAELVLLAVFSVLGLLIGFSLPLVAGIVLLVWPLALLQLSLHWIAVRLGLRLRSWWRQGRPEAPERVGLARYIWLAPLGAVTLGYALFVVTSGTWVH